jgi:hypothetical protein
MMLARAWYICVLQCWTVMKFMISISVAVCLDAIFDLFVLCLQLV